MSGPDQNKPGAKSGRRSRKAERPRDSQPDPSRSAAQDRDASEPVEAASTATSVIGASLPAKATPAGLQEIERAYGDYFRKSLEDTRRFVEELSAVHSLSRALEIQTEFATQAYATFAADSRKIRELCAEFARQTFTPSKPPPAAR
jgi:hypothetical protein